MSHPHSDEHRLVAEFGALVAQARARRDADSRQTLFTALLALERRAGLAGASDRLLFRISEARFLAGILRESVLPVDHINPRGARRVVTGLPWHGAGEPDQPVVGAAQG